MRVVGNLLCFGTQPKQFPLMNNGMMEEGILKFEFTDRKWQLYCILSPEMAESVI